MLTARTVTTLALTGLIAAVSTGCVDIAAGEIGAVETVEKRFTVSGAPQVTLGTFDGRIKSPPGIDPRSWSSSRSTRSIRKKPTAWW